MKPRIFFLHTIHGLTDLFRDLAAKHLPGCAVTQIADESLIQDLLRAGGLTPAVYRRVCDHVVAAAEAGADYIQFTCSSISPVADAARKLVSVPVLKIDEPMARQAVTQFSKVGVIATNPATLQPSTQLVRDVAAELKRPTQVVSVLCAGAYDALFAGDRATHDRIVTEHLRDLIRQVDAVCLAQVSMARLADQLPAADRTKPILTSPVPAIEHLARLVNK